MERSDEIPTGTSCLPFHSSDCFAHINEKQLLELLSSENVYVWQDHVQVLMETFPGFFPELGLSINNGGALAWITGTWFTACISKFPNKLEFINFQTERNDIQENPRDRFFFSRAWHTCGDRGYSMVFFDTFRLRNSG